MHTYDYLKQLVKDINANQGTINCGHCALRFDSSVSLGKNLSLGPVPTESAHLYSHPYFKGDKISRSTTKDKRLFEKSGKPNSNYRIICDLTDTNIQFEIDLTEETNTNNELHFLPTTKETIIKTLQSMPRREKDGSAYGFILLTHADNYHKGHIINYFVDKEDNVYFIDAQKQKIDEQIKSELNMNGYRSEIFYLPSKPPEGYKIKHEFKEINMALKSNESKEKEEYFIRLVTATNVESPALNDLIERALCHTFEFGTTRGPHLAIYYLNEALHINPKHAPAWLLQGRCFELLSDYTQARNAYKSATMADKDYIPGWMALGKNYQSGKGAEDANKAKKCFEIASKINKKINLTEYTSRYLLQFNTREHILALHELALIFKHEKIFSFSCFKLATELVDTFVELDSHGSHLFLINTLRQAWKYLSGCYSIGFGTEIDSKKALECLHKINELSQPQATTTIPNLNANNNNALLPAKTSTIPLHSPLFSFNTKPTSIFINHDNPLRNADGQNNTPHPGSFLQTQIRLKEQEINLLKQENEILRQKLILKDKEIENLKGKDEMKENHREGNLQPKKQRKLN